MAWHCEPKCDTRHRTPTATCWREWIGQPPEPVECAHSTSKECADAATEVLAAFAKSLGL